MEKKIFDVKPRTTVEDRLEFNFFWQSKIHLIASIVKNIASE
jgi:hypothetical protein